MYVKGDKIVYPLYGAGVIEALEEKFVDGNSEIYYVLNIPVANMKIMIAASRAANVGMRQVCARDEVMSIIKNATYVAGSVSENWNQRYKDNLEKIRSGRLNDVTLVYRSLLLRERSKALSSAEKKMLTTAKQIIISEIALSRNVEKSEAEELLFEAVANS